jgi:UDP-N-acetylmuramoyl-tripeptide--D-alanyl-D-alanine ligase
MKAALHMIRETPSGGRKIAVLGDMLELGKWTEQAHLEIGTLAAGCDLSLLVTVGESAPLVAESAVQAGMNPDNVWTVTSAEQAAEILRCFLREGDFVLVKGSRRLQMERVLEGCRNNLDVTTFS